MNDDDTGRTPDDPATEWVTSAPGPSERAPGINDAFEATYVETEQDFHRRHLLFLAAGIAVALIAAIAIVAVSAGSTESQHDAERVVVTPTRPERDHTSTTTTRPDATVTTVAAPTTVPTPVTTPATTAAPATSTTTAAPPPTPRVTAPANAPVYVPVPLPTGVGATIGSCSWQPTGGGRDEAAGTVTNGTAAARSWTVTIHWLQNGREIAEQAAVVNLGAGAGKPWRLELAAPGAPADPFSCALSVG